LRESGDVHRAKLDAAFELLAEGANHPEPNKAVHVPRAPEKDSTREENHNQQNSGKQEPYSRRPGS